MKFKVHKIFEELQKRPGVYPRAQRPTLKDLRVFSIHELYRLFNFSVDNNINILSLYARAPSFVFAQRAWGRFFLV